MLHAALCCISSGSKLFVKVKKIFRKKNTIMFENYSLTPLGMYNGLSQVYCIKSEGRIHSISIQRLNNSFSDHIDKHCVSCSTFQFIIRPNKKICMFRVTRPLTEFWETPNQGFFYANFWFCTRTFSCWGF